MALPITTTDLVAEVRDQLDEQNTYSVSDPRILRAINRGARNAYMIIAKQYDQLFLASSEFTTDGTSILPIPEDSFARRIEYITYTYGAGDRVERIEKVHPRKASHFSSSSASQYPVAYTTEKEKIKLLPATTASVSGHIWYMRKPATLVKEQGRVLDVSGDTVVVDAIGTSLSTSVDNLEAFVNIIDPETGLAKASLQIVDIDRDNNTLTFSTSPTRTNVYNTDISSSIPPTVSVDDYISGIGGTCVMEIISDHSDYLTQYAVLEIKRALRHPTDADASALRSLEKHIQTVWSGRENDHSVTNKNIHWDTKRFRHRLR